MRLTPRYSFLLKNTMLFALANLSNKLIVFFLLPFYTAYLSTEEYAVIDLIATAQQLIFPIVTLDITEAVIRFCMEKDTDKKPVFTVALWIVAGGNVLLTVGCGAAVAASLGNARQILYFLLFSILVSVNTLLSSFYRTIDRVNVITISSILSTLIVTVMNILLIAVMKLGVDGYYLSYVCGNVIAIGFMLLAVDIRGYVVRISPAKMWQQLRPMLKYALPLIPNALFWWVNSGLDRFFLTAISGLSVVGMYGAANKIPSILSTLSVIFQQSWGMSLFRESETVSKQEFFRQVYKAYNLFLLLVTAGLILFSQLIGSLMLSREFYGGWRWVPWLLLGFYTNSLCSFVGTEFTAAKKTVWILITTAASALVNVCMNLLLIPEYTGLGAAVATYVSYFVMLEIRVWLLGSRFGISIPNGKILADHAGLILLTLIITRCEGIGMVLLAAGCFLLVLFMQRREIAFLLGKAMELIRRK